MSTILLIGTIVFSLSSFYFIIRPKKDFNSAFLVSFITLISYLVMLEGAFVTGNLYWTRWLFYGISCPLLAFEISKRINVDLPGRVFNIFLTIITMVTGTLSSVSTGTYKIAFFAVSTIAFIALLNEFYKTKSKEITAVTPFIVLGWCVFPVVFILSNEGIVNLISVPTAAGIYLALDMFTKIIFYLGHKKNSSQ